MLELYHGGLTTCSKQVRHCLREKGLPYIKIGIKYVYIESSIREWLKTVEVRNF